MKKSQKRSTEAVIDSAAVEPVAKQGASEADEFDAPPKKGKASKQAKPVAKAAANTRAKSNTENDQLVYRYCGSDDLAPSFIKRRDARCRACFKQRYGSAKRGRKVRKAASA